MRLLLTIFLFPITFYGQVAIGSSTTVNSNVILDLTNFENRGLLLNKTNPGPTAPLGNIFYNNRKNMIGVVCDTLDSTISINYLSPWKHLDANSDVTFTSGTGKVIIKNSIAVPPRVILEVEDGSINVTNGKVKEGGHDLVPAGCIMMWGGTSPPDGWLECDGAAKSRTVIYKALFDVIDSTYGPGDGSTTFNLPNFNNRFPKGSSVPDSLGKTGGQEKITIEVGNLPSHTIPHTHEIPHNHSITHKHKDTTVNTAGKHKHDTNIDYGGGGSWGAGSTYNAASGTVNTSEAGGHDHDVVIPKYTGFSGNSSTSDSGPIKSPNTSAFKKQKIDNEPPFLTIKYIIKY